jgi:glycosyltransferase involved in cell wall biosynthesis
MDLDVLVSPAGPSLNRNKYGKEYFLLQHLAELDPDIQYDTYFLSIDEIPPLGNISATASGSTRNRYYAWSFNVARKGIATGKYDIYHQMNFHYRFFNPLVIAGLTDDIPTVIGPAEPPHIVPDPSKRDFVRQATGVDWSDAALDRVLPVLEFGKRAIYDPIRQVLFGLTLRRADRVVVVNEETAELYAEDVPRSKIDVVPWGVVPERFEEGDPRESTDLVSIGSQYRRKGVHLLLQAWSQVATEFPETTVHVFGDGPQRDRFERLAAELGVAESVEFHGFVDRGELVSHLGRARAFVHPSLSEGFPHVRLEAMASACPVIASDIVGTGEMIRDGKDGLVVPVGSVDGLAQAIATLLADPELAYDLGRNARRHVEERYDWATIAADFLDIYREIR